MSRDAFQEILGVSESSAPHVLLGLWQAASEPADIYLALYERLVQVHRHPNGDSREADIVRRRLRSAAKLLSSAALYRQKRTSGSEADAAADVVRRFLRTAEFADPLELLGLKEAAIDTDVENVDVALARRLAEIDGHPDGGTSDAEHVRAMLRAAAGLLKDESIRKSIVEMRQRPTRPDALLGIGKGPPERMTRPQDVRAIGGSTPMPLSQPPLPRPPARTVAPAALLTPFDRQVLAVLIGCGGWNATSRSLLVSLAQTYQVSPDGLVTVVKGLSDYARAHRSRLGVQEITQGAAPGGANGQDGTAATGSAAVPYDAAGDADGELNLEGERSRAWNPVAMSVLASIITIGAGMLIMLLVLPDMFAPSAGGPQAGPGPGEIVEKAPSETTMGGSADTQRTPVLNDRILVRFNTAPSFLGNGLPQEGADAADAAVALPEEFDEIERKLSVPGEPSDAVYHTWSALVDEFATGWVLMAESTRRDAEKSMLEVLYLAADTPKVSDQLMQSLTPLTGKAPEPIDLWRGAWKSYLLGRIANLSSMAPVVVEKARRQLDATRTTRTGQDGDGAEANARQWLAEAASQLVDPLEYEPRAYDYWELWIAAQRELGVNERYDLALLGAVADIARGGADLVRPGPSVNVVGRLVGLIDWTRGPAVRDAFLALFDDTSVSSRDLWVLTSLLAQRPDLSWFAEDMVLPDGADQPFRARLRDRIRDAWPAASGEVAARPADASRRVSFDAHESVSWLHLASDFGDLSIPANDESKMRMLLGAARLNESFDQLFASEPEDARRTLDFASAALVELTRGPLEKENGSTQPHKSSSAPVKPGQPIGPDGAWTARYEEARRDTDQRLDMLSELGSTAGTDLGPTDAATFVREVYRGVPQDIRTHAQSVLLTRFSQGPIVAMELLDQFPDAAKNRNITDFITDLTGRVLPDLGSGTWMIEARRALIDHALQLHRGGTSDVDAMEEELTDVYADRRAVIEGGRDRPVPPTSAIDAVRTLVEARRRAAGELMTSVPVPDDLPGLHRRRVARLELVDGPIQQFVAEQVSVMELQAYTTAAMHPGLRDDVTAIVANAAERRAASTHVLDQAIETERAMIELNRLRLAFLTAAPAAEDGP